MSRKRVSSNIIPKHRRRQHPERTFHAAIIRKLKEAVRRGELPGNLVIDGRSEGNIAMNKLIVNKLCGYVVGTPDISILNGSCDGKWKQLNIELKAGMDEPRQSQVAKLLELVDYQQFPVVLQSEDDPQQKSDEAVQIVSAYVSGPAEEMYKYQYNPI